MVKMKNLILLLFVLCLAACKENKILKSINASIETHDSNVDANTLELDANKWWTYDYNNISLAADFIALNDTSEKITKNEFLAMLTTGNYIPLKQQTLDSLKTYKLFKLGAKADESIRSTIKSTASVIYRNFKVEQTNFPDFSFTDLNGKEYNNANTKGKTVVLKCWFIGCKPCVAEFPELNELVERHVGNENILFISLAMDSKHDLDSFLLKKEFKYETIPNQRAFMDTILEVKQYPTHFVINEIGKIVKVVNKSSELISYLEEGQILRIKENKNPPPPPFSPSSK